MADSDSEPELQDYSLVQLPSQSADIDSDYPPVLEVPHSTHPQPAPRTRHCQSESYPSRPSTDIPPELRLDSIPYTNVFLEPMPVTSEEMSEELKVDTGDDTQAELEGRPIYAVEKEEEQEPTSEIEIKEVNPSFDNYQAQATLASAGNESNITSILSMAKLEDFQRGSAADQQHYSSSSSAVNEEESAKEAEGVIQVAVQRGDSGQVVVNFRSKAESWEPAIDLESRYQGEEETRGDVSPQGLDENHGSVPVSDHMIFEQIDTHSDMQVQASEQVAEEERATKELSEKEHRDTFTLPTVHSPIFDKEQDDEYGKDFSIISESENTQDNEEDKFSTPRTSPVPEKYTAPKILPEQASQFPQHVPYGYGPSSHSQDQTFPQSHQQEYGYMPQGQSQRDTPQGWNSPSPYSADAEGSYSGRPSPAHVTSLRDSRTDSPADFQRSSPSPRMQSSNATSGAFRPIPQRPQRWASQEMLHGSIQCAYPQQYQRHSGPASQPYGQPGMYQQTPPKVQQRGHTPTGMHHSYSDQGQLHRHSAGVMPLNESDYGMSFGAPGRIMSPEYGQGPNPQMYPQHPPHQGFNSPVPGQYHGDPVLLQQHQQYWQQQQQQQSLGQINPNTPGQGRGTSAVHHAAYSKGGPTTSSKTSPGLGGSPSSSPHVMPHNQPEQRLSESHGGKEIPSPPPLEESTAMRHERDTRTSSTIKVTCLDGSVDQEFLQLYFEATKKSGGGSITSFTEHADNGIFLITFEDPEVATRVIQRNHTVSNITLVVTLYDDHEEASDAGEKKIACTVQVSGGPVVLDEDMMDLYFTNSKKSGGGAIVKMEMLPIDMMTLITFEDIAVAQTVVTRQHVLGKTTLTVEHYKPPNLTPPTKILVQELLPKACNEDLLQLYFEKVGDGDVVEVQLDKSKAEAVISFKDASSVEKALENKTHKVGGGQVTVSVYTPSRSTTSSTSVTSGKNKPTTGLTTSAMTSAANSSEPCCTVEIRGLSPQTKTETVALYFENTRRSNGGPLEVLQYDTTTGVAILKFKDADTAQRVLAKEHTLDNNRLELSFPSSKAQSGHTGSPTSTSQRADNADDLNIVCVQGLPVTTSQDYLANYFENAKRSGGGDVQDVRLDVKASKFFVTFVKAEDASRVSSREHKLEGSKLTVTLYRPPEMCTDRLLLKNLPELKSAEQLRLFVENTLNKAGLKDAEVDRMLFADEDGTAVVIFGGGIGEFKQLQQFLTKKPFHHNQLSIEQVPVSSTVLVSTLPSVPPVTRDTLLNYFENTKRSNGGDVDDVKLLPDQQSALVTFTEVEVAARVARKQHKIQDQKVNVNIYMECLGVSGGRDEPAVPLPPSISLEANEFDKVSRLEILPGALDALQKVLGKCHGRLDLNKAQMTAAIHCTLSPEISGMRELVKTWAERIQKDLNNHLKDIFERDVSLTSEEFNEVKGLISEMVAGSNDSVAYHFDTQNSLLLLIHHGEQHARLIDDIMDRIKQTKADLHRKNNEKTEKVEQQRAKLQMLQGQHTHLQGIKEKYPKIVVDIKPDQGFVELKGLHEEIQEAKLILRNIFLDISSSEHRWENDLQKELMSKDIARELVLTKCLEVASNDVLVDITAEGVTAVSLVAEKAELVQTTVRKLIQRRVVKFAENTMPVVNSMNWKRLKTEVMNENEGIMVMQEDGHTLTIVSVSPDIQTYYKRLRDYLEESSVRDHEFPLPRALHKLFKPYVQKKVNDLQLSIDDFNFDEFNDKVTLRGNVMTVEAAQNIYRIFRQELSQKQQIYTEPSIKEFFEKPEWRLKKAIIEHEHNCLVLDPKDLPDSWLDAPDYGAVGGFEALTSTHEDFVVLSPMSSHTKKKKISHKVSKQRNADPNAVTASPIANNRPKVNIPARPRIYLSVMSDITKEEHHVLVNSSNTNLDMSRGQVSKALLEVGGGVIQQDLMAKYPQGIKPGDLAVSVGGKLMCKHLIHCCLPEEKDEMKIKKVVQDSVMKCMAETEKLQMGSIGFPSLGTGNLGYPVHLVAEAMFEAALDYGRKNPDTVISDVFFILHNKDGPLTQVFRKEDTIYKQALLDSRKPNPEETQIDVTPINRGAQGVKKFLYFQNTKGSVTKIIIGLNKDTVQKAQDAILDFYNYLVGPWDHDVPKLGKWDSLHIETLQNACRAVSVDITFNFDMGRLQLRGFKTEMDRIPVDRSIKEAEKAIYNAEQAEVICQQVQWNCVEIGEDGEHLIPYGIMVNYKIEMAYQNGDASASFSDDKMNAYIIKFASMEEIPEYSPNGIEDAEPIRVIRQNKIESLTVSPPKEWSNMGSSDMDVVPVQLNTAEYTAIQNKFMSSLNSPASVVKKIFRIQNLMLYQQYAMMKQQMERTMPSGKTCEKRDLWHGTKEEAVDGIIKYGFNRSYSDLKKSAYGQGAYFAASAQYSSRNEYAMASTLTKERNMFMCKVLVGEYTLGTADLRIPPLMVAAGSPKRYDSTVDDLKNPSIFVTYSDIQAYPEYRIVFTDS